MGAASPEHTFLSKSLGGGQTPAAARQPRQLSQGRLPWGAGKLPWVAGKLPAGSRQLPAAFLNSDFFLNCDSYRSSDFFLNSGMLSAAAETCRQPALSCRQLARAPRQPAATELPRPASCHGRIP